METETNKQTNKQKKDKIWYKEIEFFFIAEDNVPWKIFHKYGKKKYRATDKKSTFSKYIFFAIKR